MNLDNVLDIDNYINHARRTLDDAAIFVWKVYSMLGEIKPKSSDKLLLDTYKESYEEIYHHILDLDQEVGKLTSNLMKDWRVNKRFQ